MFGWFQYWNHNRGVDMGNLIVIEGTDCSGKGTQSEKLFDRLLREGYKVFKAAFPMYGTPTGKIVGGPYLGKETICKGWFPEGAEKVPGKVASLYFAADRLYNIDIINKYLSNGYIVILDRYVTSNMAYQAGKIDDKKERAEMFKWLEKLEYDLLELPRPDIKIFLHMPYEYSKKLQLNRHELDEHEKSDDIIINAENAYLEMVDIFDFTQIECISKNDFRTIDDISEEIYNIVINNLDK